MNTPTPVHRAIILISSNNIGVNTKKAIKETKAETTEEYIATLSPNLKTGNLFLFLAFIP
jgi:hypothetical protein